MKENYNYPLMPEWERNEIITMVEFYAMVEDAYQTGVARDEFLDKIKQFKQIEPSIAAQKQLDRRFKEVSGFSIYRAIKAANESDKKIVKVK